MLSPVARQYLLYALQGTPDVLEALLQNVQNWDFTPDPERFTLREIVAHLADWEPVCIERFTRIRDEDEPHLPSWDENAKAIEHDYAHSDPHEQLILFRERRATTLDLLRAMPEDAWTRIGHREVVGAISIESQVTVMLGHDGYHTQQIAQWRQAS
jgi:hypothetical protein